MIINGYLARLGTAEYEASPDGERLVRLYADGPAPGFERIAPDRYRRLVLVGDLDWFGYARTVATWRELPVLVLAEDNEDMTVEYLGGIGPLAVAAGFTRVEPGVYQGVVPRSEVTDQRQVRTS
ncbi:hypothetical protein Lfu02_14210 [Longispora fulva]|uniref:Uncharacterized protein n=1 Tax=Longispora fulva TaxID=619741 RepID=A0A8J7KMJ6_9ACTN|nr:hypothetical protein [Longispora fulva]MBG6140569.1 hypothetical protein [Longispora fulva]GIG57049.1 hypothetical protein Lfu02_14210 [Longispora fulva]